MCLKLLFFEQYLEPLEDIHFLQRNVQKLPFEAFVRIAI